MGRCVLEIILKNYWKTQFGSNKKKGNFCLEIKKTVAMAHSAALRPPFFTPSNIAALPSPWAVLDRWFSPPSLGPCCRSGVEAQMQQSSLPITATSIVAPWISVAAILGFEHRRRQESWKKKRSKSERARIRPQAFEGKGRRVFDRGGRRGNIASKRAVRIRVGEKVRSLMRRLEFCFADWGDSPLRVVFSPLAPLSISSSTVSSVSISRAFFSAIRNLGRLLICCCHSYLWFGSTHSLLVVTPRKEKKAADIWSSVWLPLKNLCFLGFFWPCANCSFRCSWTQSFLNWKGTASAFWWVFFSSPFCDSTAEILEITCIRSEEEDEGSVLVLLLQKVKAKSLAIGVWKIKDRHERGQVCVE